MGHPWIPDVKIVNYATVKICSASPLNKIACWASERDLNNREYPIFTLGPAAASTCQSHELRLPRIAGHMLSGTEGPGAQLGQ